MKIIRSLALVGLLASLPFAASAATAVADTGFYLGTGVGSTNLNLSSTAFGDAGSKDEVGVKITGGFQFHPMFAAEVSYYYPGEFTERDGTDAVKVTANIFQGSLVGRFPIAQNFHAFGRVGFAYWDGRIEATSGGLSGSLDETGSDLNWGVGLGFDVTEHLSLRGEFEQTKIDTDLADVLPVTWRVRFFQLAALYRF